MGTAWHWSCRRRWRRHFCDPCCSRRASMHAGMIVGHNQRHWRRWRLRHHGWCHVLLWVDLAKHHAFKVRTFLGISFRSLFGCFVLVEHSSWRHEPHNAGCAVDRVSSNKLSHAGRCRANFTRRCINCWQLRNWWWLWWNPAGRCVRPEAGMRCNIAPCRRKRPGEVRIPFRQLLRLLVGHLGRRVRL